MKYVLIAGSGTGGHIFPAIAVAKELKRLTNNLSLLFIHAGNKRFDDSGFRQLGEVVTVPGAGMPRGFSIRLPLFLFQTLRSLFYSYKIIKKYSPGTAVGFGNFGSYGPLKVSAWRKIPVFLHEANSIPGKANRMLAKIADFIGVNFPKTASFFNGSKVEIVGMPVRPEFNQPRRHDEAIKYYGLDSANPVLLVTGGSQGARHINEIVCDTLPSLKELGMQIIHLTGKEGYEGICHAYKTTGIKGCVKQFEENMKMAFDAADIVISRSGASSLAEISATGKSSILVPYPFATDSHQFHNATYFSENNAAILLLDSDLSVKSLVENVKLLLNDEIRRKEIEENCARLYNPDSAERMARIILGLCITKENNKGGC